MDLRRETFSITFLPEFERGWDSQKLELSADCRWNELCSKSCRNSALGAAHIVRNVFRKGSQTVDGASMNQPDTFASLPRRKFPVLVDVHAAEHLPDLATVSIRRDKDTTLRSRVKHFFGSGHCHARAALVGKQPHNHRRAARRSHDRLTGVFAGEQVPQPPLLLVSVKSTIRHYAHFISRMKLTARADLLLRFRSEFRGGQSPVQLPSGGWSS